MEKVITISKESYESLLKDSYLLLCLQSNGVDNWEWFEEALTDYNNGIKQYLGENNGNSD